MFDNDRIAELRKIAQGSKDSTYATALSSEQRIADMRISPPPAGRFVNFADQFDQVGRPILEDTFDSAGLSLLETGLESSDTDSGE